MKEKIIQIQISSVGQMFVLTNLGNIFAISPDSHCWVEVNKPKLKE